LILASALVAVPGLARAQWALGSIMTVFIDPADLVLVLSQPGSCGSSYFTVSRGNANFKEMVALSLTAFAASKDVSLWVTGCAGNRQVVSHGGVYR
jgi:hypothetical protein